MAHRGLDAPAAPAPLGSAVQQALAQRGLPLPVGRHQPARHRQVTLVADDVREHFLRARVVAVELLEAELAAGYGLEIDFESVPGLLERHGLVTWGAPRT